MRGKAERPRSSAATVSRSAAPGTPPVPPSRTLTRPDALGKVAGYR